MRREDFDWTILRGAISIFLISLLSGGFLIGGSWYFKNKMLLQYDKDKAQFQVISNKYLAVDEEEKLIREYYPEFVKLYKKGMLGLEQRLNWIETLRASGERIKLPALRYDIDSQSQYTPDFAINPGKYQIYSSNMKLTVDLLHEGDLLRLLDGLDEMALGTYNVSTCKLTRRSNTIQQITTSGNIAAECELRWFNIKKSDGREINLSS